MPFSLEKKREILFEENFTPFEANFVKIRPHIGWSISSKEASRK